jgi:anti-anti-sigma factor
MSSFRAPGDKENMPPDKPFHCEMQRSKEKDERGNQVTTVKCHGRLVGETVGQLKEVVKPLIPLGGRIIVDLEDLTHMDSAGLGAVVGLKVSAINQGYCILELANITPRVMELLRLTHLAQMFS